MAKIVNTSGKRKRAIARATLKEGNGIIRINKSLLTNYGNQLARMRIQEPLEIVNDVAVKVNIDVNVRGGGWQSQAEASRLAMLDYAIEAENPILIAFPRKDSKGTKDMIKIAKQAKIDTRIIEIIKQKAFKSKINNKQ